MKTKVIFIDEITGGRFDTEELARKSESQSLDLKNMFSFVVVENDPNLAFANGNYSVQRTQSYYDRYTKTLVKAIEKYKPWIADDMHGKIKDVLFSCGVIGRYLDNGKLYKWFSHWSNICPKCYREWGQAYYSLNCKCGDEIK